jgi:lipoate-protein ligase B
MDTSLNHSIEVFDCGLLEYAKALTMQKALLEDRVYERIQDRLVLLEHPTVITIGKSGNCSDLRRSLRFLQLLGVDVFLSDRGGRATVHGPGQLIAYPIIKLQNRDLHLYIKALSQTVIDVLKIYGLNPETKSKNPGIWVNGRKIASIGIGAKKWVTSHGVGLNINTDLTTFGWIIPCGQPDEVMTSMAKEIGQRLDFNEVKQLFIQEFNKNFGYEIGSGHVQKISQIN